MWADEDFLSGLYSSMPTLVWNFKFCFTNSSLWISVSQHELHRVWVSWYRTASLLIRLCCWPKPSQFGRSPWYICEAVYLK
jgi:hypothetical protein